jgi:hypothetical protein
VTWEHRRDLEKHRRISLGLREAATYSNVAFLHSVGEFRNSTRVQSTNRHATTFDTQTRHRRFFAALTIDLITGDELQLPDDKWTLFLIYRGNW